MTFNINSDPIYSNPIARQGYEWARKEEIAKHTMKSGMIIGLNSYDNCVSNRVYTTRLI